MRSCRILIRTPGYWPLPKFRRISFGGKWAKLAAKTLGEKSAEYAAAAPSKRGIIVMESSITKALPKKIIALFGRKRAVLSRWIGGIYSSANPRNISHLRLFYNSIAPIYNYHVEPERKHQLAAFVDFIPAGSSVLDASAGDCMFARAAKNKFDLYCSDLSEGMLNLRDKKQIPPRKTAVASASNLPFPAHSFDAVVHTFSNIHSLDRKKFFREFFRVLKVGGALLYHPVKSPGEQWPKDFVEKSIAALRFAGFSDVRRVSTESKGKKKTALVFYLAKK